MRAVFLAALMLCACNASASEVMVGMASVDDGRPTKFDGGRFHGLVSTGQKFKAAVLAVAHRTLPLHSCIEVKYRGRARVAEVNDRGPCLTDHCQRTAPARIKNRVLDMTPQLAQQLGCDGLCRVSFSSVPCNG